jgi:hypothetical protein
MGDHSDKDEGAEENQEKRHIRYKKRSIINFIDLAGSER